MLKIHYILFFVILLGQLTAQNLNHTTFHVYDENGVLLDHPFTGGQAAPQYSEVDLNNDGLMDLYVYDHEGTVNSTYLNTGDSYIFAPEYTKGFPRFSNWVHLEDYNGDGVSDIFASADFVNYESLNIYQGYYDNDTLRFEAITFDTNEPLYLPYFDMDGVEQFLEISGAIRPSINDIDNDGDLDIISIVIEAGHFSFYQNMSVENGWGLDSLYYVLVDDCFGGSFEDGGTAALQLADLPGECAMMRLEENNHQELHGSYSALAFDNDGDGDKDLLYGDGSFQTMNLLTNGESSSQIHFTEQDTFFPVYDTPIDGMLGPLAFYLDATFDGTKDLLVSSKITNISFDGASLLYENIGTTENPTFEYKESYWLTSSSIDYGKLTHPTFTDYNQDGKMDMVIGSQTVRLDGSNIASSLILYENTGSFTVPEFTLVDLDWLSAVDFGSYWLNPTFGDLDNDGDNDLLLGNVDGQLIYYENNAGAGMPYSFEEPVSQFMNIDVGATLNPQIFDLDDDGQKDIIIGFRQGIVSFYKNIGTNGNPMFDSDPNESGNIQQLGGINLGIINTTFPFMTKDENGVKHLYVGTTDGPILQFNNINGNEDGMYDLVTDDWLGINVGELTSPTFVDIDRDGYLNAFVGNFRGGITSWESEIYVADEIVSNTNIIIEDLAIFPNPAKTEIHFSIPETIRSTSIYNALGQLIQVNDLHIRHLPKGIYILEVRGEKGNYVGKFVKE